ncbi:MAG: hypothetical protein HDS88_03355 [Bacteroidales bacterium]|nr:hypothetical protein [Bacteroidales bacterium]
MKFFSNKWIMSAIAVMAMTSCSEKEPVFKTDTDSNFASTAKVQKRDDMRIFVHYMPWFQSKDYSGAWGMHWTMDRCNPDNIKADGKREIASHFYPLAEPYDSRDPVVLDYHALLMKYSGIEGVLVDWYGSRNGAESTEALFAAMQRAGLELAIVYEDRNNLDGASSESQKIKWGQDDMVYLYNNFFKKDNYTKIDDKPLLMCFGPIEVSTDNFKNAPTMWSEIFSPLTVRKMTPCFLALYGASKNANDSRNKNAMGEFTWVNANNADFLDNLKSKFNYYMGSAYPGFKDYYKEGGWGDNITPVDYRDGQEFRDQLTVANSKKVPMLQLVTWNDFGEGTQIEPTVEDRFKYLEMVQDFAQVKYDVTVLESIYQHYLLRRQYAGDADATARLNEAFKAFANLEPEKARSIMKGLN